jgi:hypothetical protein
MDRQDKTIALAPDFVHGVARRFIVGAGMARKNYYLEGHLFWHGCFHHKYHPHKLKEPVRQHRLFQLLWRRRREITYKANFITSLPNPLDASPTSLARLHNVFYEPFLRNASLAPQGGNLSQSSRIHSIRFT